MESYGAVISNILERIRAHQASGTGSRRSAIPPGVRGVGYEPYRCTPTTWGVQETTEPRGCPSASAEVPRRSPDDPPGRIAESGSGRNAVSRRRGTRKRTPVEASGLPGPRGLLST